MARKLKKTPNQEKLKMKEQMELIDKGALLDFQIKQKQKQLDKIKDKLKRNFTGFTTQEFLGKEHSVKLMPTDKTNIDPQRYHWFCKKNNMEEIFYSHIKVNVSEARKFHGESSLAGILEEEAGPIRIQFNINQ